MSLKWFTSRLRRNIFSGSWCICVSEESYQRCLKQVFLLNWVKISLLLKSINGGVGTKNFLWLKWSCPGITRNIFSGSRCIRVSEKSHRRCLIGSFLMNWVKISLFLKFINGRVGNKKIFVTEMILLQAQ